MRDVLRVPDPERGSPPSSGVFPGPWLWEQDYLNGKRSSPLYHPDVQMAPLPLEVRLARLQTLAGASRVGRAFSRAPGRCPWAAPAGRSPETCGSWAGVSPPRQTGACLSLSRRPQRRLGGRAEPVHRRGLPAPGGRADPDARRPVSAAGGTHSRPPAACGVRVPACWLAAPAVPTPTPPLLPPGSSPCQSCPAGKGLARQGPRAP